MRSRISSLFISISRLHHPHPHSHSQHPHKFSFLAETCIPKTLFHCGSASSSASARNKKTSFSSLATLFTNQFSSALRSASAMEEESQSQSESTSTSTSTPKLTLTPKPTLHVPPPSKRHCVDHNGGASTSELGSSSSSCSSKPSESQPRPQYEYESKSAYESASELESESELESQHTLPKMACPVCHGEGRVASRKRRTKKQKRMYQHAKNNGLPLPPPPPVLMEPCRECNGCGIVDVDVDIQLQLLSGLVGQGQGHQDQKQPRVMNDVHVGIIGGGIGGLALALACQHRNIPYTVYERDVSFDQRSQGYGLTMQQGGKALQALGLELGLGSGSAITTKTTRTGEQRQRQRRLGIHSKRHIVHRPDGTQVGQWGFKVWGRPDTKKEEAKRQNAHIARQELRRILYEHIIDRDRNIKWGHKLLGYREERERESVTMTFETVHEDGEGEGKGDCEGEGEGEGEGESERSRKMTMEHEATCTVLVGADGIRSAVRRNKIGEDLSPFRYLGCIVILGIAPSPESSSLTSDHETVFQTADGETRLYAMPFAKRGHETANAASFVVDRGDDNDGDDDGDGDGDGDDVLKNKGETMWQLSFPMSETEAKDLSRGGPKALKAEALRRCGSWHIPIPDLLQDTPEELISGYPVYDRDVLEVETFRYGCGSENDETNTTCSSNINSSSNNNSGGSRVTLLGDAAHPMSPFKGQGANQALLDAVLLARALYRVYRAPGDEEAAKVKKTSHTLEDALMEYETSMLKRSKGKVKASAEAAKFLHTEAAISEGNVTRGAAAAALTQKD